MKPHKKSHQALIGGLLALAATGLVVSLAIFGPTRKPAAVVVMPPAMAKSMVPGAANAAAKRALTPSEPSSGARSAVITNWPTFQKHAFPVAIQKANYQWTMADGTDTNVILHLAHNALEYQRMVTENQSIYRRQLVYFAQGFDTLAQQARQTGGNLHQIALPGLDGQVFPVDVQNTDLRDGGARGQLYGQLPGQPDSMVTVAFANDREAFTIISPQDRVYLQAEAHEPGEVVVKSINPDTYGQAHH